MPRIGGGTNIIDLRDESDRINRDLAIIGQSLRTLFMSDEERALEFAEKHTDLAKQIARATRLNSGTAPPVANEIFGKKGGSFSAILARMLPPTIEEERFNFERAQKQGPQLVAMGQAENVLQNNEEQKVDSNIKSNPNIPNVYDQILNNPNIPADVKLAAAPKIYEELQRTARLRAAISVAPNLFGPNEEEKLKTAISFYEAGQKELGDAFMPPDAAKKLDMANDLADLQKKDYDLQKIKDADALQVAEDKLYTPMMVKYGFIKRSEIPANGYIKGAKQTVLEEIGKINESNRRLKEKDIENKKTLFDKLMLASAMEIAATDVTQSPQAIATKLKSMPEFNGMPDAILFQAAAEGKSKYHNLTAPKTEFEAKMHVQYSTARAAIAEAIELSKHGYSMNPWKANLAFMDDRAMALSGAGTGIIVAHALGSTASGAAAGSALGPVGTITGALTGALVGAGAGAIAAPAIRTITRSVFMNEDDNQFFTAAQNVGSIIYRGESGAQVRIDEERKTYERITPFDYDGPATRQMKISMLESFNNMMSQVTGMEPAKAVTAYQTWGHNADKALEAAKQQDAKVDEIVDGLVEQYKTPMEALKAIQDSQERAAKVGQAITPVGDSIKENLKRRIEKIVQRNEMPQLFIK